MFPPQSTDSSPTARPSAPRWLPHRLLMGDFSLISTSAALVLITVTFGLLEPSFLSERNLVNLMLQTAGLFATAIGVVFVLLVAEIDMSIAYVGAVGSVTMTLLLREDATNWPWWMAIGAALLLTTLIGLVHGTIITRVRAPSFVVTLAGLLAWSGVVLVLTTAFSTSGTIIIQDPVVLGIANSYLPAAWSWVLYLVSLVAAAIIIIFHYHDRQAQRLPVTPPTRLAVQFLGAAILAGAAIWYVNRDRGVPVVTVISLMMLVFWTHIANNTRFGRHVYAVGGNPEAAHRAGLDVDRIRTSVFMISSFMAGVGAIILASRLRSVDTNSGGGTLFLNAIAAAVVGGTSLFGGRGRVSYALMGALIIASVENGMGLLGLPVGVKSVINSIVLLVAVLGDALTRRARQPFRE